jgi:ABC-2 type transport system permease protein
MLPQLRGHAHAGRALRTPLGLAFRLQRGAWLGWAAASLGFGMVMGGLVGQARDMTGSSREWYLRTGGSDQIVDAYRASVMQMAGMVVAG